MKKGLSPVVFILDDDPDDQLLLKNAFEDCREGVQVRAYESGEYLLDRFDPRGGEAFALPDLIVIDPHLAGDRGFELIERIKSDANLKHIPLIVLTSLFFDTEIKQCYEMGANTVITKPDSYSELVQIVKKVCDYWFGAVRM